MRKARMGKIIRAVSKLIHTQFLHPHANPLYTLTLATSTQKISLFPKVCFTPSHISVFLQSYALPHPISSPISPMFPLLSFPCVCPTSELLNQLYLRTCQCLLNLNIIAPISLRVIPNQFVFCIITIPLYCQYHLDIIY